MSRIDKRFLYVAIVYGIAGMIIGVWLGTRYASLHFWIASIGTLIFAIGVYTVTTGGHHIVMTIGSILMILSMFVFLVNLIRATDAGDSPS